MRKFNLLEEIIAVSKTELLSAVNAQKPFGITYDGRVVNADAEAIFIFKGTAPAPQVSALARPKAVDFSELLGSDYKVFLEGERVLIKAAQAWRNRIIGLNMAACIYDDSSAEGVSHFPDKALEDIGWHADEFGIAYRDLVEVMEAECDGLLLCIEVDKPYQFSGMGFVFDLECARKKTFAYAKKCIETLLAEGDEYSADDLSADEEEAARFFSIPLNV